MSGWLTPLFLSPDASHVRLPPTTAPRKCGPSFAIEGTIAGGDDLTTARALYRRAVESNPDRVILLADRARILARSDRPETMPG